MAKTRSEIKNSLDTLLRMCFCMMWITGTILMVANFAAYEADTRDASPAWAASKYALLVIINITAHAYLVDRKVKEGKHE